VIFYASMREGHVTGDEPLDLETLAAQAGIRVRVGDTISTAPPIDPSTTFIGESVEDVHRALEPGGSGYAYSRNANPTVTLLEDALRGLEGAEDVVAFGSGMAAISSCLAALRLWAGDTILAGRDLYGVTRTALSQLAQYDVQVRYVDIFDAHAVETALDETGAAALYFETVSNPLLRVPDVAMLAEIARRHHALTILDNSFTSPYLFRPLSHGADIVIESATKYLAGHGDATVGICATSASLGRRVRDQRTVQGGVLSPFEAWLTLRGLRTLPVRLDRQCASAAELAGWLQSCGWVRRVHYPGLETHPHHATAARQFGGRFGGMVSFELQADREGALRFLDSLRIIIPGTSLGDVESLILYPPLSSHRGLSDEDLASMGIGPSFVRLSVGLESVRDLKRDLQAAAETALNLGSEEHSPIITAP
jgi:cystathionine gamma-synthase/methionine-gamma-lyase